MSFIAERNGGLPYVRTTIATPIDAQVIVNLDERLNVKRAASHVPCGFRFFRNAVENNDGVALTAILSLAIRSTPLSGDGASRLSVNKRFFTVRRISPYSLYISSRKLLRTAPLSLFVRITDAVNGTRLRIRNATRGI